MLSESIELLSIFMSLSGDLVEINTNLVLFCFFKPAEDAPHQERCLILKFLHTRLLTQSEQFANELTRHLDICAPTCRILRQKVCRHDLPSQSYVVTLAGLTTDSGCGV